MNYELMQTLAWSLLHFLWQGTAIAALAAAALYVFRSPTTRYLIGIGAVTLMLVSFAVTFATLNASPTTAISAAQFTAPLSAAAPATVVPHAIAPPLAQGTSSLAWVAQLWLAGVCLLALRVAFGLLFLERLRRRNLGALPDALVRRCLVLQRRLGISRVVRYCECRLVAVPAVIGMFRPIVLLPVRALTGLTPSQLEAVIAHELGHIKRFDVAVNFLQVIAETLFFFHPAVWWLNQRIRADREDCCDDLAIAACGEKAGYARALAIMEEWRDVPHLAMAATGSSVAERVARLLGVNRGTRSAGMVTAAVVLTAALAAGAVSLTLVNPAEAADRDGVAMAAPAAAAGKAVPAAPAAKPAPPAKAAPAARPAPAIASAPAPSAAPAAPPARDAADGADRRSYIGEMSDAGFKDLGVEQLIAMKIHGITPDYVKAIRDMGYDANPDQLVAMKVHEVTAEYVRDIRNLGFAPTADEIIAMKTHEITPQYIQRMREMVFEPTADELIALKVHDITVEYRDALASAGYELNADELIQAKVMDITPDFIRQVRAHGFKDPSMDQLIRLKNADIL
jgi:beta-lactamase regulating signal transducer with metallopeptidase domain